MTRRPPTPRIVRHGPGSASEPPWRFANLGRGLPGGPSQSQGGGVEASRRETPRSYALALGRSLNARYQRATFLHPGSIGAWENSANSSAARSVQSAIVGRSPATNGFAPMAASSTFRLAARRVFAFSAASGDCLNRLAMNGCVFWKYWPEHAPV